MTGKHRRNEQEATDSQSGRTIRGTIIGHDPDGQHSAMRVRANGKTQSRFVSTDSIKTAPED